VSVERKEHVLERLERGWQETLARADQAAIENEAEDRRLAAEAAERAARKRRMDARFSAMTERAERGETTDFDRGYYFALEVASGPGGVADMLERVRDGDNDHNRGYMAFVDDAAP
jgi:hypothetical protein